MALGRTTGIPRLALVAAMPFPLPQGSQVFLAGQARALARAGAGVTVVCYGGGTEPEPDSEAARALCEPGVRWRRAAPRLSRTPLRSGFAIAKPVADVALAAALLRAARSERFDAILAHNAEAMAIATALRRPLRAPVLYVAHTLWADELACYLPAALAGAARTLGAALDVALARRGDAVIALSRAAEARLGRHARGPVVRIPPGLEPEPPPPPAEVETACARHGLRAQGFVLHAGNLDAYQDLPLLARAAGGIGLPVVAATHARHGAAPAPLRTVRVRDARELRALTFGCAAAVLARRRAGGFPVKLLNYMEAARPIVAFAALADGLEDARSALLLPPGADADALGAALRRVLSDPARAAALGQAARAHLEARHAWPALARQTLELVGRLRGPTPG